MIPYSARPTHFRSHGFLHIQVQIYMFFFARLKSYLQVMRADRSPAACNRVLRLIITTWTGFSSVTRDRLAAYYRALDNHGIDIPEEYVREARYLETEDVAKQTEYLLDLPDNLHVSSIRMTRRQSEASML